VKEQKLTRKQRKAATASAMSWSEMRYGKAAANPLFWDILNARNALTLCDERRGSLRPTLMLQLVRRALATRHEWIDLGFFEAAAKALKHDDAQFFKESAKILEQHIGRVPRHSMDLMAAQCLMIAQSRGQIPTKRELREMCLHYRAEVIVYSRLGGKPDKFFHFPPGAAEIAIRPTAKAEVEKELVRLKTMDARRTWNWTQIFKRAGAAELPADKGGQPSHKAVRYRL